MGLNLLSKLCRYRIFLLRSLRGFTFWMLGAIHTSATKSSPYKAASVTWRINASPVLHGIFTFREPVFSEHLQTPPFLSPPSYLPPTSLLSLCRSEVGVKQERGSSMSRWRLGEIPSKKDYSDAQNAPSVWKTFRTFATESMNDNP